MNDNPLIYRAFMEGAEKLSKHRSILLNTQIKFLSQTGKTAVFLASWGPTIYYILLLLIIIDHRWLSLIIIDCRWLSLIVVDYTWLLLIIIDYHWLSLIVMKYGFPYLCCPIAHLSLILFIPFFQFYLQLRRQLCWSGPQPIFSLPKESEALTMLTSATPSFCFSFSLFQQNFMGNIFSGPGKGGEGQVILAMAE